MIEARAPRSTTMRLRGCATVPAASGVVTKSRCTGRGEVHARRHMHHAAFAQEGGVEGGERGAFDRRMAREMLLAAARRRRGAPRPGWRPGRRAAARRRR